MIPGFEMMLIRSSSWGKMLLLLLIACLIAGSAAASTRNSTSVKLEEDLEKFLGALETYTWTANDVVFLIDESGSIGFDPFQHVKVFAELIVRLFAVSAQHTRIAVVPFASDTREYLNYMQDSVGNNMCSLLHKIKSLDYREGGTYTDLAMNKAGELLKQARPHSNRIIVLFTDGKSNEGHDPIPQADQLKREGVIIFSVGVSDVTVREVTAVATENNFYIIKDFSYITSVNKYIRRDKSDQEWDYVPDTTFCNSFCESGRDCCDIHSKCYCGTKGGDYECACDAGYYGNGHKNGCYECPKGTYKPKEGKLDCTLCPEHATTTSTGSTSFEDCFCQIGYETHRNYCKPVECPKLHPPPGGVLIPGNCNNVYGTKCSLRCKEGFCPQTCKMTDEERDFGILPWNREPLLTRSCLETRRWTGQDFYCEEMTCPVLNHPLHGKHNCSTSNYATGASCSFTCDEGYELEGPALRKCLLDGTWDGYETVCSIIQCDPIKLNEQLMVKPKICGVQKMPYLSKCQYYCKEGYSLISNRQAIDGKRQCLQNKTWSKMYEKIHCSDVSRPTIICPPSIITTTDLFMPTAMVYWNEAQADDNVFVSRLFIKEPFYISKTSHAFSIGVTKVVYEAVDSSGLSNSCSFEVTVEDKESPVLFCPKEIEIYREFKKEAPVKWTEPVITDNSGYIASISSTVKNGASLPWGKPIPVSYTAIDKAGNIGSCSFNITVKPYQCPYIDPPKDGFVTCDKWQEGRVCSVSCRPGYYLAPKIKTPFLLMCDQSGSKQEGKGKWISFPEKIPVKLPLQDCASRQKRKGLNTTISLNYTVDYCTTEKVQQMKKSFVYILLQIPGNVLCNPESGCNPENVNVTCHFQKRTKRSLRDENAKFILEISLNTQIYPQESSKEEMKSKILFTKRKPTISGFVLKEVLAAATQSVKDVYKITNVKAPKVSYDVVLICSLGQIRDGDACINCPAGHFMDGFTETCTECKAASYQDEENSRMCKPCPVGYTTYEAGSKSFSDCKGPCLPGTYSRTTFEPCTPCPKDTYQDQYGQKDCFKCPKGFSTWRQGSKSFSDCVLPCPSGSFSDTGLEPCELCAFGFFQPLSGQKSCNQCANETTTLITGSTSLEQCQDPCKNNGPCFNGATCTVIETSYSCLCVYGYIGEHCETAVNLCQPDTCFNNGVCLEKPGGFNCLCPDGFTGIFCEDNIDDCAFGDCQNGGECVDLINDYKCICTEGFTGQYCEINVDDCIENPCQNGGTCFDKVNGYRCCCSKGFSGLNCAITETPCTKRICKNGGTCDFNGTMEYCLCPKQFKGDYCEKEEDPCNGFECQNTGLCQAVGSDAVCSCPLLFDGPHCEYALTSKYSLKFSTPSTANYVELQNPHLLQAVTVSFFMRTDFQKSGSRPTPFSYSYFDKENKKLIDNGITLYDTNLLILYIHGEMLHTGYAANSDFYWHHYAITWERNSGRWSFFVDGRELVSGEGIGIDKYIWPGVFILGQEQDSLGGSFSSSEAFSGEIADFNVWSHVLLPEEVFELASICGSVGNVMQWVKASLHIQGSISLLTNADFCSDSCSSDSCLCREQNKGNKSNISSSICNHVVQSCFPNPCANRSWCHRDATISYCDCSDGYEGRFCEYDINECLVDNGGCSHFCINSVGSFECFCPEGMILSEDGLSCKETSFCTHNGKVYLDGEKWIEECSNCICERGKITCQELDCDTSSTSDCSTEEKALAFPGECCPKCTKYAACSVRIRREILLAKSFDITLLDDCIHGHYRVKLDFNETNNYLLTIYEGCTKLQVTDMNHILLNSLKQTTFLHSEFKVETSNDSISILSKSHVYVKWYKDSIEIQVPESVSHTLCGLCKGGVRGKITPVNLFLTEKM